MSTLFIRRRQQHVGILSDGMWTAHGRRRQMAAGVVTTPARTTEKD